MNVDTHREKRHCLMKFSLEVLAKREINNVYWSSLVKLDVRAMIEKRQN